MKIEVKKIIDCPFYGKIPLFDKCTGIFKKCEYYNGYNNKNETIDCSYKKT